MKDIFADIATKRITFRDQNLIEPQPIEIPKKNLPLDKHNGPPLFNPLNKMATKEELYEELKKYKQRYLEFFKNYAPPLNKKRIATELKTFDWRVETKQDRLDYQTTLAGSGKWEKVRIPHYGPPLGKAVTYYRTTVLITNDMLQAGSLFVCFKGVDYKAHVFMNNAYLGSHEGFFAPFEFDFTQHARLGKNTLLVKVENDFIFMGSKRDSSDDRFEGDKLYAATGCGYDDPEIGWHHCPPGMGIYQDVSIEARNRIHIHDIFIRPLLNDNCAEAWIEIFNCDIDHKNITLELSLYGQNFRKTVFKNLTYVPDSIHVPGLGDVAKRSDKTIPLYMKQGLNLLKIPVEINDPKIWEQDSPWLYQLQVRLFDAQKSLCDTQKQSFGMRSFRMDVENKPKGRMFLNENPIRLRGANTMGHLQQCVIKKDWEQLRDDILLAKICNMNFLRITQRPVQPEIYEFCDKLGMMTQTDLPLFGVLRRNKFCEALRQTEEMERLVRKYPSNILISYINEPFPNGMDQPHRHLVRSELEDFFRAADIIVKLVNPDRVIKAVDGEYDPPGPGLPDNHCYCGWYNGHGIDIGKLHKGYWQKVKPDWFYGCGEFGAEGLDPVEIMKKYYPESWLPQTENDNWTPDQIIDAQAGRFHYLWYETPDSMEDWVQASHKHQAWVIQLMTSAFRRNSQMNTFAIHLFIDAFPSGWMKTIMDVERNPKSAYFIYRDLLTPLIVDLRCDRTTCFSGENVSVEAWICNDLNEKPDNINLAWHVEMESRILLSGEFPAAIPVNSSECQGLIQFPAPKVQSRSHAIITLALLDSHDNVLYNTQLDIEIFPHVIETGNKKVHLFSGQNQVGKKLIEEMNLEITGSFDESNIIIIDNYTTFQKNAKFLTETVKKGAIVVFFELPEGKYRIAETEIKVKPCGMGERHFVSGKTGHPLVKDFKPFDFRFWHNSDVGYVTPFLTTTFEADGWNPVLLSGNGDWQGNWKSEYAAAEFIYGKGCFRICQLQLPGRIKSNPTAYKFTRRLLNIDIPEI